MIKASFIEILSFWRECTKPDHLLAEGDTVSARGFGKFELTEVGGTTKKGRISIVVKRFI